MADMQFSPDAFSSLLSDPRALSAIAEIMSSLQKGPPPSEQPPPPPPEPSTPSSPDLSGILGAALSSPEVISALPSVLSMLSGMGGGVGAQPSPPPPPQPLSLGARGNTPPLDRRCALLNALKPYLPEDKRSTVDTVVRVIEIMSLIK